MTKAEYIDELRILYNKAIEENKTGLAFRILECRGKVEGHFCSHWVSSSVDFKEDAE